LRDRGVVSGRGSPYGDVGNGLIGERECGKLPKVLSFNGHMGEHNTLSHECMVLPEKELELSFERPRFCGSILNDRHVPSQLDPIVPCQLLDGWPAEVVDFRHHLCIFHQRNEVFQLLVASNEQSVQHGLAGRENRHIDAACECRGDEHLDVSLLRELEGWRLHGAADLQGESIGCLVRVQASDLGADRVDLCPEGVV